ISVDTWTTMANIGAHEKFGVAIPVGLLLSRVLAPINPALLALSVAISITVKSTIYYGEFWTALSSILVDAGSDSPYFYPQFYYYEAYYIREAGGRYPLTVGMLYP
ncbi:MAG: hypothetical protein LRS43_00625, partial [Desulfurococcales archaeon]|nr:hypothetical protein [Desulfurococcales archaeon]